MNLKTVVLTPDRNLKVSNGWYVTSGEEFVHTILLAIYFPSSYSIVSTQISRVLTS